MSIIVTGGAGFLGSRVIAALLAVYVEARTPEERFIDTFDRIGTGYGQRHTFPLFSNADNYEMTGLPGFGYQRGFDFKLEDLFGKAAFGYDSVHCSIRLDL